MNSTDTTQSANPLDGITAAIESAIQQAREQAGTIIENARAEAEQIVADARAEAEQIIADAGAQKQNRSLRTQGRRPTRAHATTWNAQASPSKSTPPHSTPSPSDSPDTKPHHTTTQTPQAVARTTIARTAAHPTPIAALPTKTPTTVTQAQYHPRQLQHPPQQQTTAHQPTLAAQPARRTPHVARTAPHANSPPGNNHKNRKARQPPNRKKHPPLTPRREATQNTQAPRKTRPPHNGTRPSSSTHPYSSKTHTSAHEQAETPNQKLNWSGVSSRATRQRVLHCKHKKHSCPPTDTHQRQNHEKETTL